MTLNDFLFITWIQTGFLALVAFASLFQAKRRSKVTRLIGFLYLIGFSVHIFSFTVKYINFTSLPNGALNNLAGSTYNFFLVVLLSYVYFFSFNKKFKTTILTGALIYLIFALSNLIFFQKTGNASYNSLLASFIIICYAVIYFYRLLIDLPEKNLYQFPMFWFNTAFLFFHSTTFFIYAFVDYLIKVLNNNLIVYYSIHNVFSIIECILLLIGLYYDWSSLKSAPVDERLHQPI